MPYLSVIMALILHLLACACLGLALEFSSASPNWSILYQSSRSTWTGLRLTVHYNDTLPCAYPGQCPDMDLSTLKNQVVPEVVEWFGKVLKVPSLTSPLRVPLTYCGQVVVPEGHRTNGVADTDAVIYIATVPLSIHRHDLKSYGTACLLSAGKPNRVVAGTIWLAMDWFSTLPYQKQVDLLARHMAQILAFDPLLFPSFTKPDGSYYDHKEMIVNDTMAGQPVLLLTLPTVVAKSREAFNCPTLKGVRLEGHDPDDRNRLLYAKNSALYGSNFTSFLSLWSGRMMLNDFMADLIVAERASYSDVTMAVFEDSGWYSVNWAYTTIAAYGYKRGCEFFTSPCGNETQWTGFCENGTVACSPDLTFKGICEEVCSALNPFEFTGVKMGGNPALDFCPIVETGTSCLSGEVEVEWEEKCEDCRCFTGSLNFTDTHCHRVVCGDQSAQVTVGNVTITCPSEGGTVPIEGFTGQINCPPFHQLCVPLPSPNLCSGQENCFVCPPGQHLVSGNCESNGRLLQNCHLTCATCSGPGERDCLSCYEDALLPTSPGMCLCKSSNSTQCTLCHPQCLTCSDEDPFYCLECHSNAELDLLSHICTCEEKAYPVPDSSNCQLCHDTCQSCTGPEADQCISCNLAIFDEWLDGKCVCSPKRYYNATEMKCVDCSPFCALCTSPACIDCQSPFYLDPNDFSCRLSDGYYWDEAAQTVLPCPSYCKHCHITPSQTLECTECMDTFTLQTDATCSCADGYSVYPSSNFCSKCREDTCLKCEGWDWNCIVCVEGYHPVWMYRHSQRRWAHWCYQCPDEQYMSLSGACEECSYGCKYCLGPEANNCTICLDGFPYKHTIQLECVCPSHKFPNPDLRNCTICHEMCQECTGPEVNQCISCHSGRALQSDGTCIYVCDRTCLTCFWSLDNRGCTTCKNNLPDAHDGVCECPRVDGKYEVRDDCRCGWECGGCDEMGGCAYCRLWWHHRFNATDHTCICPIRHYPAPDLEHCERCHDTCEECWGPNNTQCIKCSVGLIMVSDGTCQCPYGSEWRNYPTCFTPSFLCIDQFCSQCRNEAERTALQFAEVEVGLCSCQQPQNGVGVYLDIMAGTCGLCFPLCTSCARDPQMCRSCIPNVIFTPMTPNFIWGSCSCPRGTYYEAYSRDTGTCVPCSTGCLSCQSEITCDECQYGYALTQADEGPIYCSCAGSICGCSLGLYELAPMMSCEDFCPTGYLARSRACLETIATPISFQFDNYQKSFLDSSERYYAQLGSESTASLETDPESPLSMYPGNLYFSGNNEVTIRPAGGHETLVLAPAFYIEFWQRGSSLISVSRPDSFLFSSSRTAIFLVAKNVTNHTFEWTYAPISAPDWSLVRYEVVVWAKTQTNIRIYLNNTRVFSETVEGFFFRDSVLYNPSAEQLSFQSNGTKIYMGPLAISNSIWKEVICQVGGINCPLAECGYREFRGENGVCQTCKEGCFYGCIQASDCRLPIDMFCANFSQSLICETCVDGAEVTDGKCACVAPALLVGNNCWTDPLCAQFQSSSSVCRDCKAFAQFDLAGTCECIANSTYSETNRTCSCLPHYAFNGTACLFEPDPLCIAEDIYTSCPLCKSLSFLQDNGVCECVGNSTFAEDTQECVCNHKFESAESYCAFIEDPMCLEYGEVYDCELCETLAYVDQGNCSCTDNAHFVENSCECNLHFQQNGVICEYVEDPLCEEYDDNGLCASCKVHSELLDSPFCNCSLHSHLTDSENSCICDSHYVDSNGDCVYDVDPICNATGEFVVCPECSTFASLDTNTGYCVCQANMELSASQSQCVCKPHFSMEGNECTFDPDPVCLIPEAINCYTCRRSRGFEVLDGLCASASGSSVCAECVELARFEKDACRCVRAAQYFNSSCVCAPGYFPDNNLCIPDSDPLCLNETATPCETCKALSTLVDGVCKCTPNARYNAVSQTCACLSTFASFNNACIDTSSDPMCLAFDLGMNCTSCKEKAKPVAGACSCVDGANYFAPTAACKCRNRYTPTPDSCIFQSNPLCAKYENDQCTSCTPLSTINATGECSCVKNSALSGSGSNCMCDFHYQPSGNACVFDPDPLCTAYTNTVNCASCKANSQLNVTSGYCNCANFYLYSPTLKDCEPCDMYYSPSEITANFGFDMNSLIIDFSSPPTVPSQCQYLFETSTWTKFGSNPICQLRNSKLTVILGSGSLLSEGEIGLISANLLKRTGPCVLPTLLQPFAKFSGDPALLKTCPITAPTTVPLSCSQSSININAENSIGGLGVIEYYWTFTHSSEGLIMPQYRVWSAGIAHITLPSIELSGGVLHVEVQLRDRLSQTCSSTADIKLDENIYLPIRFDSGLSANFTSQDQGEIRAVVTDSCGAAGLKRYVWSFIGAEPPIASDDHRPFNILGISKVPYALAIPKNSLGAGYRYTYGVEVTQGKLTGTANLVLSVRPSPLNIRLNRISGNHPNDMALTLNSILSTDPDGLPGSIETQWACLSSEGIQCRNSNGGTLLSQAWTTATSFSIPPDQLQLGANYTFTATITKGNREAYESVSILIVETVGCGMVLAPIFKVCNIHQYFYIVPTIQTLLEVQFRWTQTPTHTTEPCTAPTASFLAFNPNTLTGGIYYQYELKATTVQGAMSMKVDFYVNAKPTNGLVNVSPYTGFALEEIFYMSSTGWSDYEENYPLRYQFCCRDSNEREICFTGLSFEAYFWQKLFWGCSSIVVKVIDTVGGENQASISVQVSAYSSSKRALAASDLTASFLEDIDDPENTLSMVSAYSRSVAVDQTLFSAMTSAMNRYADALFQVTPQVMTALLGAQSSLAEQNITQQASNGEILLLLLNKTLSGYIEEVTEDQLTRIFEIASVSASFNLALYSAIISTAVDKYYSEKLPSSTGFHFVTPTYEYFTSRQVNAAHSSISLQQATISIPSDCLTSAQVLATDILDVHVEVNVTRNSTEIVLSVWKSGTYSNYNVQLGSRELLNLINTTLPFNISIAHYLGNQTLECVGLDSHQNWTTSLCSVRSVTNTTATLSTQSFTSFLLRPASIPLPLPDNPIATAPIAASDSEDSANPAPVVISFALIIGGIVAFVVFRCISSIKYAASESQNKQSPRYAEAEKSPPPEQEMELGNDIIIEFPPAPSEEEKQESEGRVELNSNPPTECRKTTSTSKSVSELHLLLGIPKRPEMVAELLLVLLTDIMVLGVCYVCWLEGEATASSASDVFDHYSGEDVKFVGVAVACGTVLSCVFLLRRWVVALGSAVATLLEFGAILYLNIEAGYEESGRWAIGLLIALALQLLLETGKSFVAAKLMKAIAQDRNVRGIKQ